MQGKRPLTSIPEKNEAEDEVKTTKWVPKKKHEVLKAKYKCLKKLFQIYDASVIGILPDCNSQELAVPEDKPYRRKRSHRTKTDACAGTSEVSSGCGTDNDDKSSIAATVIRDLNIQCSCSTQAFVQKVDNTIEEQATQRSKPSVKYSEKECECTQTVENNINPNAVIEEYMKRLSPPPLPYLMMNERRKPTRFQCFMQRIFGLKQDRAYRSYVWPDGHVYASSENNITRNNFSGGRRRRRLRIRRTKRVKKINSDTSLLDLRSPVILTYVQSVQRSCLMDTTPRQCPIVGCRMMFYGIINYNDHLNLCHFTDRKYICHYCHEGFQNEFEKHIHENEHIGITKLNLNDLSAVSTERKSSKKVCNTQTDPHLEVPEEKLKKMVSFFDKIVDNEVIMTEIGKNCRCSDSNFQRTSKSGSGGSSSGSGSGSGSSEGSTQCLSDKRTVSCGSLSHANPAKKDCSKMSQAHSDVTSKRPVTPVKCRLCGENFDYRRQLSLHVDLEHRIHDKFSKFHSCAGLTNDPIRFNGISRDDADIDMRTKLRRLNTSSTLTRDTFDVSRRKSLETLSCDPSTNIIYYESMDNMGKKSSVISSFVQKVKSGITNYKWESGTKIIRI